MSKTLNKSETFAQLPPEWSGDLLTEIRELVAALGETLVVLDDDPTGTQTVYDLPVLTCWDVETLKAELDRKPACFYILTNSRSLTADKAEALNREIASNLKEAAGGHSFHLVSRSDSTLRGHYPLETDVLDEQCGPYDGVILVPYFEAGGRYTINGVHYVAEDDQLLPASDTPFAKDAVFGYSTAVLEDWVEEKTDGRIKSDDVKSVSITTLRKNGPSAVAAQLNDLKGGQVLFVNAACPQDLNVFVTGLLQSLRLGKRFLYRSGAQLVSAMLGLEPKAFEPDSGKEQKTGGLMVAGSYVPKTSAQLEHLFANGSMEKVELHVPSLLGDPASETERLMGQVNDLLSTGRDVVLYTSRDLVTGADAAENLSIGNRVSEALVKVVQGLSVCPRFLIAKGGITSSDVASRGFGIRRAIVLGALLPGVPVWECGDETRFPGLPYVVFPGNVGGDDALTLAVQKFLTSQSSS